MVRLGEHDFTTTKDGQHQDIRIALAEPHEKHDDVLKLNDIAILHLYYDVLFNGNYWNVVKNCFNNKIIDSFTIAKYNRSHSSHLFAHR